MTKKWFSIKLESGFAVGFMLCHRVELKDWASANARQIVLQVSDNPNKGRKFKTFETAKKWAIKYLKYSSWNIVKVEMLPAY